MITIREIFQEEYVAFRPMLFEQYKKYLSPESQIPILPIGAWVHGKPRGFVLIELPSEDLRIPMLRSIFINPAFRRLGIGTALLQKGEVLLCEMGHKMVEGQYEQHYKSVAATEALLWKNGWQTKPYRVLPYATYDKILEDPLLKRVSRLPGGYSLFLWKDLSPGEELLLKEAFERKEILPHYNPFTAQHKDLLPQCSLGLRYGDTLIGWILVQPHHLPRHIYITNMFVVPEHAHKGLGLGMVYEVVKRAVGDIRPPDWDTGIWQTFCDNAPMIRVIEKHLAKHCHQILRYNLAVKSWGELEK